MLFDRNAKSLFPTAVRPAEAETALTEPSVQPGNGSDLFAALALADELLANGPGGHRMVLAFTDLGTGLVDPEARYADGGALPRSRAVLNIVSVRETAAALSPWEGARGWHAVARATGGLLWKAPQFGENTASDWSALSEPTCIRDLRIVDASDRPIELERERDDGNEAGAPSAHDELCEGEGGVLLQLGAVPWRWVTVEGQLGAERIRARVLPSAREARVWSALAIHHLEDDLSSRDMVRLARRGHELSPAPADLRIGAPPDTDCKRGITYCPSVRTAALTAGEHTTGAARRRFPPWLVAARPAQCRMETVWRLRTGADGTRDNAL